MIDIQIYKDRCYRVVGAIYNVKQELGPGLNEKVYQEGLALELKQQGIAFERERAIHPVYKGTVMDSLFYLDFFCEESIIVELKSVKALDAEHRAQLFNYMHIVKPMVGVLVNFAPRYAELERYFYDEDEDQIVSIDGKYLRNKYDDDVVVRRVQ